MKKFLAILVLLFLHTGLSADTFTPSHYCTKPSKPYEFTDQWQVNNYNNEVQRYKNCIVDFANEQNDAIEEWNRFANY